MSLKVTRIATGGTPLAGGSTLDAEYTGDDVDITTGLPLDGLLDVNVPAPDDGDVLTWDDGAGEWIAAPGGGAGGPDVALVTVAAAGATETIDVSAARTYDVTLTDDCTLSLTGAVGGEAWWVTLLLRQDGTGGWDVTWPGSVEWPTGGAPTIDPAINALTVVTLGTVDGGTVWLGFPTGGATADTFTVISPAQLTGNTNNWNPTGLATADEIRVSTDDSHDLTGIVAPAAAKTLLLVNVGDQELQLVHDATSTAANRFICPETSDLTLGEGESAWLVYDMTTARWRVIEVAGAGGASLTVEDEGTPLATAATTLDFVGAGVVASGTGATKTITISGASVSEITDIPTAETDDTLRLAPDGAGGVEWAAGGGGGGGATVNGQLFPEGISANSWGGYSLSASESYSACPPWMAFGGIGRPSGVTGWLTNGTALPQWIKIQLPEAAVATSYAFMPWWTDNYPSRTPKSWVLEGSNDDSSWTTLDTQTDNTTWLGVQYVLWGFPFSNTTAYSYYRWTFSANQGGNAYTGIGMIRLSGPLLQP